MGTARNEMKVHRPNVRDTSFQLPPAGGGRGPLLSEGREVAESATDDLTTSAVPFTELGAGFDGPGAGIVCGTVAAWFLNSGWTAIGWSGISVAAVLWSASGTLGTSVSSTSISDWPFDPAEAATFAVGAIAGGAALGPTPWVALRMPAGAPNRRPDEGPTLSRSRRLA